MLYLALFAEIGVIMLVGCALGAIFGFLGQAIGGRWMALSAGQAVAYEPAVGLALQTVAIATLFVVLATAIPARLSLRFDPHATFSPE